MGDEELAMIRMYCSTCLAIVNIDCMWLLDNE